MPRPPFALSASMMFLVRGCSWRTPDSGFSAVRTHRSVSPSLCLVRVRVRARAGARARVGVKGRIGVRGLGLRLGLRVGLGLGGQGKHMKRWKATSMCRRRFVSQACRG